MSATESPQVDDELDDEAVMTALKEEMLDAVLLVQKSARGSSARRRARERAAVLQEEQAEFEEAALLIQRAVRGCLGRKRAGEKAAGEMNRSCKRTSDCAGRIKESLQQLGLTVAEQHVVAPDSLPSGSSTGSFSQLQLQLQSMRSRMQLIQDSLTADHFKEGPAAVAGPAADHVGSTEEGFCWDLNMPKRELVVRKGRASLLASPERVAELERRIKEELVASPL